MESQPKINSKWVRSDSSGVFSYTVIGITNTEHRHEKHPEQVVYQGDNGFLWSLPLSQWPGNLVSKPDNNEAEPK